MPITFSGRWVAAAILVNDIDEVLLASIAFVGANSSNCLKMLSLSSTFSVAASITKSTSLFLKLRLKDQLNELQNF